MKIFQRLSILITTLVLFSMHAMGQVSDTLQQEYIAVAARPSADSVSIRWAPLTFRTWQLGNEHGYRIERYLITRNDSVLPSYDKLIVHAALKPLPEIQWATLVANDKYAAIAAQALLGERFEVDLKQSDVFTIVNKVQENEQRFAFALFAADMSLQVATASGLFITDKNVRKGERYLYRIVVQGNEDVRGSIFVSPDDPYTLHPPLNLKADFKDRVVSFRWDKSGSAFYSAYILERSSDGKTFNRISDTPLTTVTPTDADEGQYEYAVDSLPDVTLTYHYRVRGLTPFGETGPPSNEVHGKSMAVVEQVPYITSAESPENRSINIRWQFPSSSNRAIHGFEVQRANQPNGNFMALTEKLLPPQMREFTDGAPEHSNYYKVMAHGLDGEQHPSHVYFAQLVDSIPPTSPSSLEANVNDAGMVTLRWTPNTEPDIYGYRVYKSFHESEELAQITSEPVTVCVVEDTVNLNTLNEHVYYSVMSIDRNQNHSLLSDRLKVRLPDKVKPQPPVLISSKTDSSGVSLTWWPGASKDIVKYKVYRKKQLHDQWLLAQTISAGKDTIYHFRDDTMEPGTAGLYTLVSVDESGLESNPTSAVISRIPVAGLRPRVIWKRPHLIREENQLTLSWQYKESHVETFRVFRSIDNKPLVVLKNIKGSDREFTDSLIPGTRYTYRIMALFENGQKSSLSDQLEFTY